MSKKNLAFIALTAAVSMNAHADYFSTTIDINQTLAVSPSNPGEMTQYSGTIDLEAISGVSGLFSGDYDIFWGSVVFNFNQADYLAGTPPDLVFDSSYTYVTGAGGETLEYDGQQYNYVVDFIIEDYYYDLRQSAEAMIDLPYNQYTYMYDSEYNQVGESYNVPPGTSGIIERYTNYDYIETLSDTGSIWYDISDFYPDGVVDYTASATNAYLDFESIDIYMEYEPVVVPVPAALWLFGSGLIGLVAVARRKA